MSEARRVLVVSNMYPSAEHPAAGIFVHEQVKALRQAGLDARVVCGRPLFMMLRSPLRALWRFARLRRQPWPGWETYDGVPVTQFRWPAGAFSRRWNYPWFYAAMLRRWLPRLAADFPYDIVHVHTAYLDGRAGIAAARHRGVPLVLTEHTGPLTIVTADPRMRSHVQAGVAAADRLIAVSHALREDMLAQLKIADPARLGVLPNGVDTGFFDPARADAGPAGDAKDGAPPVVGFGEVADMFTALAHDLEKAPPRAAGGPVVAGRIRSVLAELKRLARPEGSGAGAEPPGAWADPGAVRALWVGHHVEVKRVDRLLDAFATARRQEPRLLLTLVGNGPLEPALYAQATALGLDGCVRFMPAASREQVRDHMAAADFLVLPSESETFGVVVIEALSMGLPVLATDCGGPRDIVSDPALGLLAPNTLEGIATGLQRMAHALPGFDRDRIRATAIARFDYAQLAASLATLYQEVATTRCAALRTGRSAQALRSAPGA